MSITAYIMISICSFPNIYSSTWNSVVFLEERNVICAMIAVIQDITEIPLTRYLLFGGIFRDQVPVHYFQGCVAIVRTSKSVRWPKPWSERLP
jgi:hypothetical protein